MTDRDRDMLIALLCNEFSNADVDWVREKVAKIADHLIANGVTVNDNNVGCKWISVKERLPDGVKNLVTDGKDVIMAYTNHLFKDGEENLCVPARYGTGMKITHWMPLPKSPKGVIHNGDL